MSDTIESFSVSLADTTSALTSTDRHVNAAHKFTKNLACIKRAGKVGLTLTHIAKLKSLSLAYAELSKRFKRLSTYRRNNIDINLFHFRTVIALMHVAQNLTALDLAFCYIGISGAQAST